MSMNSGQRSKATVPHSLAHYSMQLPVDCAACLISKSKIHLAWPITMTNWSIACGDGLLWEKGVFAKAYKANRASITMDVVENSPVASAVQKLISGNVSPSWEGTATELLHELELIVGERESKTKHWPPSAAALGRQIKRIATPLRRLGIEIASGEREGHARNRIITIGKSDEVGKSPSAPSAAQTKPLRKPLFDNDFSDADSADSDLQTSRNLMSAVLSAAAASTLIQPSPSSGFVTPSARLHAAANRRPISCRAAISKSPSAMRRETNEPRPTASRYAP